MLGCPKAKTETEVALTTPLESKGYVQMTMSVLDQHGIKVSTSGNFRVIRIPSNQEFKPSDQEVPGDFSSAAFLFAAAAITRSHVFVENLTYEKEFQGDKAIIDILTQMGTKCRVRRNHIEIDGEDKPLRAFDLDAKNLPDLVPVCTVLACYARGISRIHGAQRLRYKESDRLLSLHLELRKMGADITMDENSLIVRGLCALNGTEIDPHNDHRIAMACAVAALGAQGETTINNAECVKKSYPKFFYDLCTLGADIVGRKFDW
jgi:3-phosphoshikimate 1-carboxyvinyltransferase